MIGRTWLHGNSYLLVERANFKGLPTPGKSIIGSIKKKFKKKGSSGGSSSSSSSSSTAMREAEAQLYLQRELAKLEEEQRIAAEERERVQYEEDLAKFNTNLGSAYDLALQQGQSELLRRELPYELFDPLLSQRLTTVRNAVPELASNPSGYFDTNSIISQLVGDETELQRQRLNTQLNQFASPGFSYGLVPNQADDPILATILDEQYQDALSSITRARDRGNFSDFGFTSALENLNSQRSAANSQLQGIGGGVLEDFRTGLRDIAGQGRTRADSFQFGDVFDPSSVQGQIDDYFAERSGRLEGDIRSALGGEQLFNVGQVLGRAGSAQGAQNASARSPALLNALAQREEERARNRGIGSQGVF